jgi:serine/threonine-protein kinase
LEPLAPTELVPGTLLAGRYRVVRRLGAGGMGEVHVVRHELTHHERALKTLHPSARARPEVVERFLREASAAGRIGNPHIVETFDAGFLDAETPYLVMELLEGATLSEVLSRKGRLQPADACRLIVETCEALQAAHDKGIVHRDLKPENLFIVEQGGRPFVKVLDFGVSKFDAALTGATAVTTDGVVMGTPLYMAPEQMQGSEGVDARADVYALAVVLYECLAGVPPYSGRSFAELAAKVLAGGSPALTSVIPTIPVALSDAVACGLAVDPGQRVESAEAFAALLRPFCTAPPASGRWWRPEDPDPALDATVENASPLPAAHAPSAARRRWATPARVGALVAVGAGLLFLKSIEPPSEPPASGSAGAPSSSVRAEGPPPDVPHRGGTLRVASSRGRGTFDYFADMASVSSLAIELVVDRLFVRSEDGTVLPGAVDRWQSLDAGKAVELHLRDGLRFHGHPCISQPEGRAATAKDLAYSLDLAAAQGALPRAALAPTSSEPEARAGFRRVSVLEGDVVRVELARPVAAPQQLLFDVPLLPAELEGCQNVRAMERPVGTGPFRLAEDPKGDVLRLVRWDQAWQGEGDQRLPWLDAVELRSANDTLDGLRLVASGELDLFDGGDVGGDAVVELVDGVPTLRERFRKTDVSVVASVSRDSTTLFALTFLQGPWRKPENQFARRAMANALDPGELARASPDRPRPLGRILEPRLDGYEPSLLGVGKRLEASERILAEAGHPRGSGLGELTLGAGPSQRPVAEAIRESLAAIGLKVRVVEVGPAMLPSAIADLHLDAILTDIVIRTFGSELAFPLLIATFDRLGPPDAELASLLDALLAATDRVERSKLGAALERRLLEVLPVIPIGTVSAAESPSFTLVGPRVRGFADALTGRALPAAGPPYLRVYLADGPH